MCVFFLKQLSSCAQSKVAEWRGTKKGSYRLHYGWCRMKWFGNLSHWVRTSSVLICVSIVLYYSTVNFPSIPLKSRGFTLQKIFGGPAQNSFDFYPMIAFELFQVIKMHMRHCALSKCLAECVGFHLQHGLKIKLRKIVQSDFSFNWSSFLNINEAWFILFFQFLVQNQKMTHSGLMTLSCSFDFGKNCFFERLLFFSSPLPH